MKALTVWAMTALGCSVFAGIAVADTDSMVITYRSGKAQTVTLDERMEDVKDIGFRKASHPLPEAREKVMPEKQPDDGNGARKERSPGVKKTGVFIEWAPPVEE